MWVAQVLKMKVNIKVCMSCDLNFKLDVHRLRDTYICTVFNPAAFFAPVSSQRFLASVWLVPFSPLVYFHVI